MAPPRNMFWGLVVKPNKRYETEVQEPFRITKACLEPATADGKVSSLMIECENSEEFIIANLNIKNFNETLDLAFNEGEKICFKVDGPGTVHLTGNLLDPEDDQMNMVEDSDTDEDSSDEEENTNDSNINNKMEDDSDSDVTDSPPKVIQKEVKQSKAEKEPSLPKTELKTPEVVKTPKTDKQASKVEGQTPKKDAKPTAPAKSPKTTMKGGMAMEDLVTGTGQVAKKGNGVGMYYRGWLKSNNKQFDSCLTGKPFKFKLGAKQVISGWDLGVAGMKVGGKRRLTIPASLGYGGSGAPPDIPPNATLVFDVECKFVKVYGGNNVL